MYILNGECPYARHDAVFHQVTNLYSEPIDENVDRLCAIFKCPRCDQFILGILRGTREYYRAEDGVTHCVEDATYEAHSPLAKPDDSYEDGIPTHIGANLSEALRCMSVDAFNAVAEMCRRCVETSCIELGAPKRRRKLEHKIDWLAAKGKITPTLADMAHKVRVGGNRGAHPSSDPARPEEITPEHAKALLEFTKQYLAYIYVMPKRLNELDFSRSGAVQKALPPKP